MLLFAERLATLVHRSGLTQAAFAKHTGLDPSTLSLLLSREGTRTPNAQTLVALAKSWEVSVDWLLGLTDYQMQGSEIMDSVARIEHHVRAPGDALFLEWLEHHQGTRIQTVIDGVPNFLKTEDVIRFEYQGHLGGRNPFDAVQKRLALMRSPDSNLEVCISTQSLSMLSLGESKWNGLSKRHRLAQIKYMKELYESLYPRLLIYCYTLTETYSSPFTLFGKAMVTLFVGDKYLVLRHRDHIREFSDQFNKLIKLAVVQPHELGALLVDLIGELE